MSKRVIVVDRRRASAQFHLVEGILTFLVVFLGTLPLGAQAVSPCDLNCQLLRAADQNDVALVRQLLAKGADIEAKGQNGLAALSIAAERGNVAIVKLLLEKGADVNAKDQSDETALITAARSGNPDVLELLLEKTSHAAEKNAALFEATGGGPVVIEMEDPRPAKNDSKNPAPRPAPESPWVRTVKLLLDRGANLEAWDQYRGTPLLSAAALGQTDIVMLLLERGADIHATDSYGNTALIVAACECAVATMNSTYDIVKTLLEKGSDVNARNHEGTTALMNAASGFGGSAIVKLLLDNGADPAAKNKDGDTALTLAIKGDRPDKVQLLRNAGEQSH